MKFIFICVCFFVGVQYLSAQGNIGIGTNTPHPSAILDVRSNNKGILIPRISAASRTSMQSVAKGILVYDTTYSSFYFYDGGRWRAIHEQNTDSLLNDYISSPAVIENMSANGNSSARSGVLYDNGGPAGNYPPNSEHSYTINKGLEGRTRYQFGYKVVIDSFSTESPYDSLEIYPTLDYSNKKLFHGNQTGTFYFFCGPDQLVFRFRSNNVVQQAGFKIRWSRIFADSSFNENPPLYGWYFNPARIAIRGGVNVENDWIADSLGAFSFGYGVGNKVTGSASVAWGNSNLVRGNSSFAAGQNNVMSAETNYAFGRENFVNGIGAMAVGSYNTAAGDFSFAAGEGSRALSRHSVAIGEGATASDYVAVAIGNHVTAGGWNSAAFGSYSTASGAGSFTAGSENQATALFSAAIGLSTRASGNAAISLNRGTWANGVASIAVGDSSIANGPRSFAAGYKSIAGSDASIALGYNVNAGGTFGAFATGYQTRAAGTSSFAANYRTVAGGYYSFATGQDCLANGNVSTSIGFNNNVSGFGAIAVGSHSIVSGNWSNSYGNGFNISGIYSTGLGTKMTIPAHASGSMGLGDLELSNNLVDNTVIDIPNQLVARFRGGYFFISTANAPDGTETNRRGVKLDPGQNSWSAISDFRQKENFEDINGETILQKIAKIKLTTWNYIGQDPKVFRHYGPMAQDFYNAFGKDKHGTIGCDTLINQQDFLGVSFVAIQALEKRTAEYAEQIKWLKQELEALKQNNELLLKKLKASQ